MKPAEAEDGGDAAGADDVHGAACCTSRWTGRSESRGEGADRTACRSCSAEASTRAEAEVARLVLEAVEVARDASLRREHEQRRAVRELVGARVVRVFEADRRRRACLIDGSAPVRKCQPVAAPSGRSA